MQHHSKYLGSDLYNKGRYRDFVELFILGHIRNNPGKALTTLGKLNRRLRLTCFDTRTLSNLKYIIFSETEINAKNKIQKIYGDDLEALYKLSLPDIVLHEYAFLELGLFAIAAKCHVILLNKRSMSFGPGSTLNDESLVANIELDTINLNHKQREKYHSTNHKDLSFYSALVSRKSDSDYVRYLSEAEASGSSFYHSIHNSKVLIIGPKPTAQEINDTDDFDVIVIMNYHGPVHQRDEILRRLMTKEKKIIVTYFGNNASELLSASKKTLTWDFTPDFIVTKSNLFKFQRDILFSQNARTLNSVDNILTLGSGNFLQQCLYDILCFNPESIKVIGLDFWVGASLYDGEYKINKSDEKFPRYSFAAHNVFSNWLFPKALKYAGLIQCSEVVENALDLDFFEYAEALSQKYSFQKV